MTDEQPGIIEVRSTPAGWVMVTLGALTWAMSPEGAQRYAAALIARAVQAEHEAALVATLRAYAMTEELVTEALGTVRTERDRYGVSRRVTHPLSLYPGVSLFTGAPFLRVEADDLPTWQWSPADARGHALHVLEVIAASEADALLAKVLTVDLGVTQPVAHALIAAMGAHWPGAGQ